ncbi:MAG: hypothetical protein JNN11_05150 [Candidatus Doudnabacteria bacterium]|nr:hypothetical protein [Candidatus Doudnabacteria bacterium]
MEKEPLDVVGIQRVILATLHGSEGRGVCSGAGGACKVRRGFSFFDVSHLKSVDMVPRECILTKSRIK